MRADALSLAARIELERGRLTAARARAHEAACHPSGRHTLEEIETRDAGRTAATERLLAQGRRADAEAELIEAERAALAAASAGRLVEAERRLIVLAAGARKLGQELLALHAEADLAGVLLARGRAPASAQLAIEVVEEANRRGLGLVAAEAELVVAGADLEALRLPEAARAAAALMVTEAAPTWLRASARRLATRAAVWIGDAPTLGPEGTGLDDLLLAAEIALVRGEPDRAIALLVEATVPAERSGRHADLAGALADVARLHHSRGDRHAADCAATRALAEASAGGADRTVARALLVTAALAREDGDLVRARTTATDALAVARAAAATLSSAATAAAERLLADLGLSSSCAYRLITADGSVSYAARMDAGRLGLERKELVIDGDAELVLRRGKRVADLRRRTLLKRLLFLFASAPGRLYSKEEIVERIWGVEYHPLHHDAALFTNVMRLRRLLGPGGPDILRVGEGGYLLVPPHDFLFIERLPV